MENPSAQGTGTRFNPTAPGVGPYLGLSRDALKAYTTPAGARVNLRFILYAALDVEGLRVLELNGIAILHEDKRLVLADNVGQIKTGVFGPGQEQLELFDKLTGLSWTEFAAWYNDNPWNRQMRYVLDSRYGELGPRAEYTGELGIGDDQED